MFMREHTVFLSDTDTTGQVYYSKPLEWLEWCRVEWFQKQFGNFLQFVEKSGITFFPSRANVDYKRPIFFGDTLKIEMTAKEIKKVSFLLDYTVKRGEEIVLKSEITIVCFDTKKKTLGRMGEDMIKLLESM